MKSAELQKYKQVQSIAKKTIAFLKSFIKEGISAQEIKQVAEKHMQTLGADSFWYYNIGAFVFIGDQTIISISGKEYIPSNKKVQTEDLVTVDLTPAIASYWGDFARSFAISGGQVVKASQSKIPDIVQGIATEINLHKQLRNFISEDATFAEVYFKMNSLIEEFGFENLDYNNNLGHSIVEHKDDRIYIEAGNKTKFKNINLFTFEPHIKKKKGKYGFRHEDIYFFNQGNLEIL